MRHSNPLWPACEGCKNMQWMGQMSLGADGNIGSAEVLRGLTTCLKKNWDPICKFESTLSNLGLCGTIRSKKKKQKMWFIIGLPYCSDSLCGAEFRLECRCLGAKMLKTPSASCWPGAWIRVKLCCAHRWNEQNTKVFFFKYVGKNFHKTFGKTVKP